MPAPDMNHLPEHLLIIAGRGAYPLELASSARHQGVRRLSVIAFRGETDRAMARHADDVAWIYIGQLRAFLEAVKKTGAACAVMAGQIAPGNLFNLRPDREALALLASLKLRNAETIFGAIGGELGKIGVQLLPASRFMERAMPETGLLTRRAPDAREQADIAFGRRISDATSALDIGQTVVVKEGTVLAVEAFEGTDEAIRRAGRLGGPGAVVVKAAKRGHDMRFDIPVIGRRTIKSLRKARASALAIEAGRSILLEREAVLEEANRAGLCIVVFEGGAAAGSPS